MKREKLKSQTLKEMAKDWSINYQVFVIKSELVDTIKDFCDSHNISQRRLALMVPGLTQDRISKIFSGQVGHMTIDKLIEILSYLKFKVAFKAKAA